MVIDTTNAMEQAKVKEKQLMHSGACARYGKLEETIGSRRGLNGTERAWNLMGCPDIQAQLPFSTPSQASLLSVII